MLRRWLGEFVGILYKSFAARIQQQQLAVIADSSEVSAEYGHSCGSCRFAQCTIQGLTHPTGLGSFVVPGSGHQSSLNLNVQCCMLKISSNSQASRDVLITSASRRSSSQPPPVATQNEGSTDDDWSIARRREVLSTSSCASVLL